MNLNDDALVIVMSLLDQLHGERVRISNVMAALAAEDVHIRKRIAARLFE
jgi:chaperone modulatory protein CbpM